MSALLAATLLAATPSSHEGGRLAAVNAMIALARRIEAAAQPKYRTSPPTPIRVVDDLPVVPAQAEIYDRGGYFVRYGTLNAIIDGPRIYLSFSPQTPMPKDARTWNEEELLANARKVADVLKPEGYVLGETVATAPEGYRSSTDVVVPQDPRLFLRTIDLDIDNCTGFPTVIDIYGTVPPAVVPERLTGIRPEEELAADGLRVYRTLLPLGAARLARCRFVYGIPGFARDLNEMTPEHEGYAARREAIPMYSWCVTERRADLYRERTVFVDARTGRAVATRLIERKRNLVGTSAASLPVATPLDTGRWRLGRAEGTFTKVAPARFEGTPVVLNNGKEFRALSFDAKAGLVQDEIGTYRPDAMLLKAMGAERPGRPFGRVATR